MELCVNDHASCTPTLEIFSDGVQRPRYETRSKPSDENVPIRTGCFVIAGFQAYRTSSRPQLPNNWIVTVDNSDFWLVTHLRGLAIDHTYFEKSLKAVSALKAGEIQKNFQADATRMIDALRGIQAENHHITDEAIDNLIEFVGGCIVKDDFAQLTSTAQIMRADFDQFAIVGVSYFLRLTSKYANYVAEWTALRNTLLEQSVDHPKRESLISGL